MWGVFVWYIIFTDNAKHAKPLLIKGFSNFALSWLLRIPEKPPLSVPEYVQKCPL